MTTFDGENVKADDIEGKRVRSESVQTKDGFNSDIGDNIDYLDPRWLGRADVDIYDHVHEAGFNVSFTTNSGTLSSAANLTNITRLTTGTTADSKAIGKIEPNSGFQHWNWDNDRVVRLDHKPETTVGDQYLVAGNVDTGSLTNKHVGIAVTGGDLVGTVADGTSQSTTTLVSGVSSSTREIYAEFVSGDRVDFYIGSYGTPDRSITTNLPSGADSNGIFTALVFNANTAGSDVQLEFGRFREVQL